MALPKEKQPREDRKVRQPLDKKEPTRETSPRERPGFFRGARIR